MAATLGNINFGSIPVAAPNGIVVNGARQGLMINGGYVELGGINLHDAEITDNRRIDFDAGASLLMKSLFNVNEVGFHETNGFYIVATNPAPGSQFTTYDFDSRHLDVSSSGPFFINLVQGYPGIGTVGLKIGRDTDVYLESNLGASTRFENTQDQMFVFRVNGDQLFSVQTSTYHGVINGVSLDATTDAGISFGLGQEYYLINETATGDFKLVHNFMDTEFRVDGTTGQVELRQGAVLGAGNSLFELSNVVAGAATLDGSNYVAVKIGGVSYKLALIV